MLILYICCYEYPFYINTICILIAMHLLCYLEFLLVHSLSSARLCNCYHQYKQLVLDILVISYYKTVPKI